MQKCQKIFFALFWGCPPIFFPHGFTAFSDICKCFEKVSELALPLVHRQDSARTIHDKSVVYKLKLCKMTIYIDISNSSMELVILYIIAPLVVWVVSRKRQVLNLYLQKPLQFKTNMRATIEALRLCKEQTAKAECNQREVFNRWFRACFHAHRNVLGG